MNNACQSQSDQWIKEFAKMFPDKVCNSQIGVLTCGTVQPKYCADKNRLQDCSSGDKSTIYGGSEPLILYYDLMQYLESDYKCSGYCGKCNNMYLYSDSKKTDYSGKGCNEAFVSLIQSMSFNWSYIEQ